MACKTEVSRRDVAYISVTYVTNTTVSFEVTGGMPLFGVDSHQQNMVSHRIPRGFRVKNDVLSSAFP